MTQRPPLAVSFAGGGGYGVGFNMGIADGLRKEGIDLADVPMSGTSAGAITAAAIATDLRFDELLSIWRKNTSAVERTFWNEAITMASTLYPADRPTSQDVEAMVVRLFRWRRESLSSADHPLADIVAASCSVMPVVRPHRVDGRWYVDGGHISNGSIDRAPGADLLLAVTPFRRDGMGVVGWALTRRNDRESSRWADRHGGQVLEVEPPPEIAALFSPKLSDIANIEVGAQVYDASVAYGRTVAAEVKRHYPDVATRIAA